MSGGTGADPRSVYGARAERFAAERDRWRGRSDVVVQGRSITFLAAIGCGFAATWSPAPFVRPLIGVAIVSIVVFAALVAVHARVRRREAWLGALARLNREAARRLDRDWASLPAVPFEAPPEAHPYAADLDLFGRASLGALLGTVSTTVGRTTLRDWLVAPAEPGTIAARNEAVAELAPRIDLRDRLAAAGRLAGRPDALEVERFLAWCEAPGWLAERPALRWASRVVPALTVGLGAAHAAGWIGWAAWMIPLVVALAIARGATRTVHAEFARAAAGEALSGWAAPMERLAGLDARSEAMRVIAEELDAAHRRMAALGRRLDLAEARRNVLWIVLQPVLLWDLHALDALERWKRASGPSVRGWLAALGRADALAALAALAHAHPDWTFPTLETGGAPALLAEGLRHPLLPDGDAVPNDVAIGPPGTVLVVSGSNMAGKSTLLRAVGANVALAMAGGPVAARRMSLPPTDLRTAMRVHDSLSDGVSLFLAELRRVKSMVDAARDAPPGTTTLALLDEPLHGTNVADRRVAVRRVIRLLMEAGALPAVSTHDTEIVDDALEPAARHVHLEATIGRDAGAVTLDFDYRLRPGPATTSDALALMEMVGLGEEPSGGVDRPGDDRVRASDPPRE